MASDRAALMNLYRATGGDSWTNNSGWGNGNPSNSWYGIEVDANGRVTRVDLFENNLQGQLPASIGDLDKVKYLNVKGNYLTGPIPSEIGNMESLKVLILQGRTYEIGGTRKEPYKNWNYSYHQGKRLSNTNSFSGILPPELGRLSSLEILEISNIPDITGPIPPELGNLTNLKGLYLAWMDLSGYSIPPELGNLTNLKHLYLTSTAVGGRLPDSFQNLTNLTSLLITAGVKWNTPSSERLSGPLPDLSHFIDLRTLVLTQHDFTGDFPHYFNNGDFSELNILDVSGNELTGTLPDNFNNLQELYHLGVGSNNMSGNIHSLTTLPAKIRIIQVWHNNFSGVFPQSGWPDFFQLKSAYVGANPITGNIPCSFWQKLDNPKLGIARFGEMEITDPCACGAEAMEGDGSIDLTY